jgi:hypothetical protein
LLATYTPKNPINKLTLITPILSMDPLTGAAIAVGSIIATKALEKTGEKVGEKVWQQTEKFLTSLKQVWLFGLCYAMDGDYKGWNPYIERHLAIFVNCFLSRAN